MYPLNKKLTTKIKIRNLKFLILKTQLFIYINVKIIYNGLMKDFLISTIEEEYKNHRKPRHYYRRKSKGYNH